MPQPPISGVIIAFNEQARIVRAVESLRPWCAEVLVLDSHSSDRTRELAESAGARVLLQEFLGHQAQKNRAIELARHDWILSLDADEELVGDPANLLAALDFNRETLVYRIPRRNWYLGGWVDATGWKRDSSVRLFNRTKARFGGSTVHDRAGGAGCEERVLPAQILHWPYRDLSHHLQKIDAYTSALAAELDGRGARFSALKLTLDPPWKFLKEYLLLGGWRLGWRGLVLSVMSAIYVFLKYAKLWERQRVGR
ncbi:MAG: glycosyltransferase family 2 protein [Candidatus Delongbacteria bacterium]|nr:glycosyltransferase family 2 protein [Candidatus Delongbacteria bacterium]